MGPPWRWRCVAVDASWDEPWRCAFMVWDDPHLHPGARRRRRPPQGATGFARLEVEVPDHKALSTWLGADPPDGRQGRVGGDTGPAALFLGSPSGEIPVA